MSRRVHDLLDGLGLPVPDLRVRADSVSGGERQTVATARAHVSRPRLLLLGGPTAGLSVQQLRDQGVAILLVSDDLSDVEAVGDRVKVLLPGSGNSTFGADAATETQIRSVMTGPTDSVRVRDLADPAGAGE